MYYQLDNNIKHQLKPLEAFLLDASSSTHAIYSPAKNHFGEVCFISTPCRSLWIYSPPALRSSASNNLFAGRDWRLLKAQGGLFKEQLDHRHEYQVQAACAAGMVGLIAKMELRFKKRCSKARFESNHQSATCQTCSKKQLIGRWLMGLLCGYLVVRVTRPDA
jgi:hypothetical protein